MTHDELLKQINEVLNWYEDQERFKELVSYLIALRSVIELHKPELMITSSYCVACTINLETVIYPCPTIQAITEQLQ